MKRGEEERKRGMRTMLSTEYHITFFQCPVSKKVWTLVQSKAGWQVPALPWEELIAWLSSNWKGGSLSTLIKKLCLSSTIYLLWSDRNQRFHSNSTSRPEEVALLITEQVRLKLSTYKRMTQNDFNRTLQATWNLPDSIFGL